MGLPLHVRSPPYLPVVTRGMPVVARGMPVVTRGMPVVTRGMPVVARGMPSSPHPSLMPSSPFSPR